MEQLGYNLVYILNYFELHTVIHHWLYMYRDKKLYANIKVLCLIVHFITDIVFEYFFDIFSNFNSQEKNLSESSKKLKNNFEIV